MQDKKKKTIKTIKVPDLKPRKDPKAGVRSVDLKRVGPKEKRAAPWFNPVVRCF